jgi:hypothetical protein
MADVLPGFIFDRNVARFRDTARGQFVSRSRITELMEAQVNGAEQRLDQLTFRDYGAAGRQLRDSYQRMTNLVSGIERGEVTLPQALRRIEGYTLEARNQFFAAQRDAQANSGRVFEERRILHAAESCPDCIDYAAEGWVAQGQLPMIGESSQCQKYCRCTMESREVTPEMMQARLAERISA